MRDYKTAANILYNAWPGTKYIKGYPVLRVSGSGQEWSLKPATHHTVTVRCKPFRTMSESKEENIKESFNEDFCVLLEYHLTRTFCNSEDKKINPRWDEIFDMRFILKISNVDDNYEYVKKELKTKDTDLCYVISNYEDVDGHEVEFKKAFDKIYGRGLGSLLIVSSADKMYLETEQEQGAPPRFIGKRVADK